MSVASFLRGHLCRDRCPLRQSIADRIKANVMRYRIHLIVVLYDWSRFSAIREASRLYITAADGPTPPDVENTSGEKVPPSTSLILSS